MVVTYVQGSGRSAMTAVTPAELVALKRAGRLVCTHDQAGREPEEPTGRGDAR